MSAINDGWSKRYGMSIVLWRGVRPDAPGLTASTIGRLKAVWDEYEAFRRKRYEDS